MKLRYRRFKMKEAWFCSWPPSFKVWFPWKSPRAYAWLIKRQNQTQALHALHTNQSAVSISYIFMSRIRRCSSVVFFLPRQMLLLDLPLIFLCTRCFWVIEAVMCKAKWEKFGQRKPLKQKPILHFWGLKLNAHMLKVRVLVVAQWRH